MIFWFIRHGSSDEGGKGGKTQPDKKNKNKMKKKFKMLALQFHFGSLCVHSVSPFCPGKSYRLADLDSADEGGEIVLGFPVSFTDPQKMRRKGRAFDKPIQMLYRDRSHAKKEHPKPPPKRTQPCFVYAAVVWTQSGFSPGLVRPPSTLRPPSDQLLCVLRPH